METKENFEPTELCHAKSGGERSGNKFSRSKVTQTQDFYVSAVLSQVISSTSKSEDKEQARSWMGDPTDAVENAASLFMLILNHCPSGITDSTALLTQNLLRATYERQLGEIIHLQVHVLTIWGEQVTLGVKTFTLLIRKIYVTSASLEGFIPSFTHLQSMY